METTYVRGKLRGGTEKESAVRLPADYGKQAKTVADRRAYLAGVRTADQLGALLAAEALEGFSETDMLLNRFQARRRLWEWKAARDHVQSSSHWSSIDGEVPLSPSKLYTLATDWFRRNGYADAEILAITLRLLKEIDIWQDANRFSLRSVTGHQKPRLIELPRP